MLIEPFSGISGQLSLPGDKSLSHRLVLISLLLHGNLRLSNLSDCDDVRTSLKVVEQLGVKVSHTAEGVELTGPGKQNHLPEQCPITIDCGNSGTTARLLTGILVARHGSYRLTGDASLSSRPMGRVIAPLTEMGAIISSDNDRTLPVSITGKPGLQAVKHTNRHSSAQVKSAILLAALNAKGVTSIAEPLLSRNHTEVLLASLGAPIDFSGNLVEIVGPVHLTGEHSFSIPGDISSAAFFAAAAAVFPGSRIEIGNVLLNSGRISFLSVLQRMGAEITIIHNPSSGWEPSGKIIIAGRKLCATDIAAAEIPGLIDEIPALAAAMAFAEGESSVTGASELRNKESDRIKILTTNFRKAGIVCDELSDGFKIRGSSSIPGSIELDPADDHRLAMTFAILAGRSQNGLAIKNSDCVKISFPTFFSLFKRCSQG